MDIYAAQKMFGRGRNFDRIDLAVKAGITLAQGQAAFARAARPRVPDRSAVGPRAAFEALLASTP